MGASLALAGLAGCTKQPDEPIFPYVKAAGGSDPGQADVFCDGVSVPDGRDSGAGEVGRVPADQGGRQSGPSDGEGQVGCVYAGDAAGSVRSGPLDSMFCIAARQSSWADFQEAFTDGGEEDERRAGRLLPERDDYVADAGGAVEAGAGEVSAGEAGAVGAGESATRAMAASKAAFGSYTDAQYKLEEADVILSLDADFLGGIAHPGFLPMAAAYAERHRYEEGKTMNRHVRRRDDADGDGVQGGAPAGAEAERDCCVCARRWRAVRRRAHRRCSRSSCGIADERPEGERAASAS